MRLIEDDFCVFMARIWEDYEPPAPDPRIEESIAEYRRLQTSQQEPQMTWVEWLVVLAWLAELVWIAAIVWRAW